MTSLSHPPEPSPAQGSPRSLSPWSIASLVMLGLLLLTIVGGIRSVGDLPSTADFQAVIRVVAIGMFFLAAWSCALLGTICGVLGVRKPRNRTVLAWTTLALNGGTCISGAALIGLGLLASRL
jgi:hypothetical protein